MVSSLEDGGIVLRGTNGVMKLTRAGFWVYGEANGHRNDRELPEPDIVVKSTGDGTRTNLENWLDCIRSRASPTPTSVPAWRPRVHHIWPISPCDRRK